MTDIRRRRLLSLALAGCCLASWRPGFAAAASLRIGIIGAGRIGGALGELWAAAGHSVFLSSRHPQRLRDLAARIGGRAGPPREAAAFGEVVLVSVPYAGIAAAEFLAGTRLVRAFNTIPHFSLRSEAHRDAEPVGVPLAGDDPAALAVAARLVRDAGFEPVVVGALARSVRFDVGTEVFGRALPASELRRRLGLDQDQSSR